MPTTSILPPAKLTAELFSAQVIQDAIDNAGPADGRVYVPPGIYLATQPMYLASNIELVLDPGAILRREFASQHAEGLLTQADMSTRLINVSIAGGRIDNPGQHPGSQIALFGDNIRISGVQILDFYDPGLGIMIVGNDNRLSDLRVVTSCRHVGAGGIRMAGGNNFLCSNCTVSSGDDALQFVPIAPADNPAMQDVSITNAQYVNCVGISACARSCVAALVDQNADGLTMTAEITDCAFIGIRGQGGSIGAYCFNKSSSGSIARIQFIGASISQAETASDPNFSMQAGNDGASPVQQIDLIGCTALNSAQAGLFMQLASRVRWIGGSLYTRDGAPTVVDIVQSSDCELRDATVLCSSSCTSGVFVGFGHGDTGPSSNIRLTGLDILGIPAGGTGITLDRTNACVVSDNRLVAAVPDSGATGISVTESLGCVLEGNDTRLVTTPYVLTGTGTISAALGVATSAAGVAQLEAGNAAVTFTTPFLNDHYAVQLTGNTTGENFAFTGRTAAGFIIESSNTSSTARVCWSALITHFASE